MIRKATAQDIPAVEQIYNAVITKGEAGPNYTGWARGVYPTKQTALDALAKDILFVYEDKGHIVATAKIDQTQEGVYEQCLWAYEAEPDKVLVLHTLAVDPRYSGRGYGKDFVAFYEDYARKQGCTCLRMDTNETNRVAREIYKKLGFREAAVLPCAFHGITDVRLVCLEKKIQAPV